MANKLILRESGTRAVLTLVGGEHEMQPTQAQFVTDTKRYMFRDMDDAYHDILDLDPTMTTDEGHIPFIGSDTYRVAVDDYVKYDVDDHTLVLVNNSSLPQISLESPVYSLPNKVTTLRSAGNTFEIELQPDGGIARIESDSVSTRDRIRDMFQIYNKSDEDISIGFGAAFTITLENNHHTTPMEAARIEAVYTGISDPDEIELRFYVGVDEASPGPSFEQNMLTLTKDNVVAYGPLKVTSRATDDLIDAQVIVENIDLSVALNQEVGGFLFNAGEDTALTVASIRAFADEEWTDPSSKTRVEFSATDTGSVSEAVRMILRYDALHFYSNCSIIFNGGMKSGADEAASGAGAGELWVTSGHATLPNNVVMMGAVS